MITISLCMIVKNEELVLERCLDSLKDLMDEIIIVDTGSTDNTKQIADKYTDKVYDFKWIDDFSAARNYSFSKATMDYIYVADADEILDDENYARFIDLKKCMLDDIEIVQMKYINDNADNNLQNSRIEYRPKLFKRLRNFIWTDVIHEMVRLEPIVFDSDISILHCPIGVHNKRDFGIFEKQIRRGIPLSKRIRNMYSRELLVAGNKEDFEKAIGYFEEVYNSPDTDKDSIKEACAVLTRGYRILNDVNNFFKYGLKDMLTDATSEVCYDLGEYFYTCGDYLEAAVWYYNAAFETQCILDIHTAGDLSLLGLAKSYAELAKDSDEYRKMSEKYKNMANEWQLPEEL